MRSPFGRLRIIERKKVGNSRFTDGLILGAVLGGAAVFLLGTKKGDRVLKVISEGGLEGLTDIFEDFEEGVEEGIKSTAQNIKSKEEKDIKNIEEKITLETPKENGVSNGHSPRRFFRRNK